MEPGRSPVCIGGLGDGVEEGEGRSQASAGVLPPKMEPRCRYRLRQLLGLRSLVGPDLPRLLTSVVVRLLSLHVFV